jgi:pantoate--beta-alanine ligase
MKIIRSIRKMQQVSRQIAADGKKIGLVPTMGYLHYGHLSLIKKARKFSDVVITTIFVNPTQFGPNDDLNKYPRDEKGDIKKVFDAGGDIVFIPKADHIYPKNYQTYVNVEKITKTFEGTSRPGHFKGVTTIVSKLFNITRPDVAVFGLKDYQQAMVIKTMTSDLDYPVKIIVAPTVREKDGLAMSSRNKYFTTEQRQKAVCLYKALKVAKGEVKKGELDTGKIKRIMRRKIVEICPSAKIDYIAFTDFLSLKPVNKISKDCICSLAARLFGVRLIDNMKMK